MSVTAEQWVQAEAERQRQAELVQTLINEVRRLGTEQNNNLQEIQRASPAGRGIFDARIGKPPVFSGDENTWGDWSFKLRSYVSVVDLQLGQMMEAAEVAAHENAWLPSVPLNQDMDAQLRYLLVMLTSGPSTADHPTTAKWSTGIPRPCSEVQSAFTSTFPGTAARAHAF